MLVWLEPSKCRGAPEVEDESEDVCSETAPTLVFSS